MAQQYTAVGTPRGATLQDAGDRQLQQERSAYTATTCVRQ